MLDRIVFDLVLLIFGWLLIGVCITALAVEFMLLDTIVVLLTSLPVFRTPSQSISLIVTCGSSDSGGRLLGSDFDAVVVLCVSGTVLEKGVLYEIATCCGSSPP